MSEIKFSPEEASNAVNKVISAYFDVVDGLKSIQTTIDKLEVTWYGNDAKDFMELFVQTTNPIIRSINVSLPSVVHSLSSASTAMANAAKIEWVKPSFNQKPDSLIVLEASFLEKDSNGRVGADVAVMKEEMQTLLTTNETIDTAIISAKTAVNLCGFYGGNMLNNINETLEKISSEATQVFDTILRGLSKECGLKVEDLELLKTEIEKAFSGASSE